MTLAREQDSRTALSEVGRTAAAVALARAAESARADAWFTDPLALELARDAGDLEDTPGVGRDLRAWIAVRTRFLDDLVLDAVGTGIRQVVIVGAGLDARAFRLALPAGTTVYEVDRPDILTVKSEIVGAAGLRTAAGRHVVTADLTDPEWIARLEDAGWSRSEETVWLLEGLLIYFDRATRRRLLTDVAAVSVPGSVLGSTVGEGEGARRHPLWKSFDHDTVGLFRQAGWQASLTTMQEATARYGRPLPPDAAGAFSGVLVAAARAA